MKILLLGSGGREHALALKLSQSPLCEALYIAPGNAGTAQCGTNIPLSLSDFDGIGRLCIEKQINMVLVGPEDPLVAGIVDYFLADPVLSGIPLIGPGAEGAKLEGSKAYAKAFMQRHGIPTAAYAEFDAQSLEAGLAYLEKQALPIVLKADGLAAGKGVLICQTREEARNGLKEMIEGKRFGEASSKVVIEEFLDGIEVSVFVLTDGKTYIVLPEAKDYKRIGIGDTGPNTGGMGAVSPVGFVSAEFFSIVEKKVIIPTVEGLKKDGIDYSGFIFFGLIRVGEMPFVIEYNCRMGDPETQVVMPRIKNDLVEMLQAAANRELSSISLETDPRTAVTIVAVSAGYPDEYEKGKTITGLDEVAESQSTVFLAGAKSEGKQIITNGGRVLAVTSFGKTVKEAAAQSSSAISQIHFDGMYFRKDIGWEFYD